MSGFFGVVSTQPCISDLFYGTDYHSHLGTKRAGMATFDGLQAHQNIHNIQNSHFRPKFSKDLPEMKGNVGIGVISDTEAQPVMVNSHLGRFAIATVSKINNIDELEKDCLDKHQQFTDLSIGRTNPTELVALLISQGKDFVGGIENVYNRVKGSCTMLILTPDGIIAARDRYGRTPIVIGRRGDDYAIASESHSYVNLGYETCRFVGPGEIVKITTAGIEVLRKEEAKMQICSFLWIYYGYPCTEYEGVNAEQVRYNLGRLMGERDDITPDFVSPIPDSGIGMALGYSNGRKIPYKRGLLKYTPTWSRSFMPVSQADRFLVAKMKLIPSRAMLEGKEVVFCDDSIVRGTQLRDNVKMLYDYGAKKVHVRISCPPLVHGCTFLNFSESKTDRELITRRVIEELEGKPAVELDAAKLAAYHNHRTEEYAKMVEVIRRHVGVDTLKFNTIDDVCEAIGLPKERICTHCFDASSYGDK
ncbi:MAG: amidophosphoribosyltransferase [Bacteroidales bacterium]|nr:amidophosphoribosyltransferase [Bacteroidales bacterium]